MLIIKNIKYKQIFNLGKTCAKFEKKNKTLRQYLKL